MGKRIQNITLKDFGNVTLKLGYVGENEHTEIYINCAEIFLDYPDAVASLVVNPPVGDSYYADIEKSGNKIVWSITSSDVAHAGSGKVQLTFTDGEEIIKTVTGSTNTIDSLEPHGEAPEPVEAWQERIEASRALAEAAGEMIDEMTVSAEESDEVEATISDVDGHKHIAFGIPVAPTSAIVDAVEDWLEENVSGGETIAVDSSLSIAGAAADAKKTGDEVGNLKSAINQMENDLNVLVLPGDYENGVVLFTKDEVPAGTKITYCFTADYGTAAYIDVRSTADGRITYIGKGASASGDLKYEGSYTLPSNYGAVKVGTAGANAKLHILYLSTNISSQIDRQIDQKIAPLSTELDEVEDAVDKLTNPIIPDANLQNMAIPSKTDNQLDVDHIIKGIGINRTNNTFVEGETYRLSKIIPFGDATNLKIIVASGNPVVATMTEPILESRFINNTFLVSGSRTINKEIGINYIAVDLTNCTGVKLAFGYGTDAETPEQDYAEGTEVVYLNGIANEINDRKQLQAIFDSDTANVLDLRDKVWGYKINSNNTFSKDPNSALSKFIYLGDIAYDGSHQLTVSNYTIGGAMRLALLTEAKIDNSCVLNTFLLTNNSRTIGIPKEARYAVIMLATNGVDYSKGVVVRKDTSTTAVAFKPRFLGWPGNEKDFETNIKYYNEDIRKLESLLLYRRWLPMAYGKQDSYTQGSPVIKRINLMFFSDTHIDYGNAYESRQNIQDYAFIANNTPLKFDALVCGGDIMTRPNTKAKKIGEMETYFFDVMKKVAGTPVLWTVGNHDCNDMYHSPETGYTPSTDDVFTPEDYNDMWFDYAETKYGIVRQTRANGYKSTYHYYDIAAKKTRIICVDVNDVDKTITEDGHVKYHGSVGFYISQEQMDWIINSALNVNTSQNWTIVFVLHQAQRLIGEDPADPDFYAPDGVESAIEKLLLVCQAFNNGSTYTSTYTNVESSFDLDIDVDYTELAEKETRPRIACWLLGHEHADHYVKLHDINIIHTMHSLAYDYAYGDKNTAKTLGSFNQGAFDVVNIDPDERKIRMFRYGAGVNCYGDGGDRFLPDGLSY